jgi:hypothetical protein
MICVTCPKAGDIAIILPYLDDGFGVSDHLQLSSRQAIQVKSDLISSGLVPNKDKSIWTPVQSLEWLGFVSRNRHLNIKLI